MKLNSPFVITINRQLGSGGAYVGQQLAKKLNIFYADREIINMAAKKFSLLEDDLASREEKSTTFWQSFVESYACAPDVYIPPQIVIPTERELFNVEAEIIEHIAQERSAVVIGRCGVHVLASHPNRFSIFLHASDDFRKDRIQKLYEVNEAKAEKMIEKSDKERSAYFNTFTGEKWTDLREYDLSIDTSKIGLDESVDLILKCFE
jgi:cytidylate kinase